MKRLLDLSHRRQARVWLDAAPPAAFTPASALRAWLKPAIALSPARGVAGLEIHVPQGDKGVYALLGAEFRGHPTLKGLEVVVPVNDEGPPFPHPVTRQLEAVNVGLPATYAEAVLTGVARAVDAGQAPVDGALTFRWAAYSASNSSASIFEQAGAIVVRLLTLASVQSDDSIRALFD